MFSWSEIICKLYELETLEAVILGLRLSPVSNGDRDQGSQQSMRA